MDLEGVKLDVINQSKLSNSISINQKDTSQNTEAINQLRDQLSNMQSRIVALEAKLDNPLPKKLMRIPRRTMRVRLPRRQHNPH